MKRSFALFLFALLPLAACKRNEQLLPRPDTPLILISIDTLRSDHLPAYGYTQIQTPAIDAFRADSILYEHAYSHCPLTAVSHASIFTGLLPAEHGIRDNIGYTLNPKVKTIAEVMKSRGYATGGAVSAIVLRSETKINRGFDFWDDAIDMDPNFLTMGRAQRPGDETREIAQKWIGEHKSKPFFFFFHIYEPHTPYEPTYDADIQTADAIIGRFLDFLKQEGIYDRAAIILLSDHGEGLGQHGEDEHGILLYREALQVPLMIKLPHEQEHGKSVSAPVELIDIFPTVTGIASRGESLLGDIKPGRQIYSETYYPKFHFGWSDLHSLIVTNDHYIQSPKPELFDLHSDPAEKQNVLQDNRRTFLAMRTAITPFIKGAEAPSAVNPEQAQQLAALGYIGSTVSTSSSAELPDPKDNLVLAHTMGQAFGAFQQQKYEEAIRICNELLHQNPNMIDMLSLASRSYAMLGERDEAIDVAKRGLHIEPSATNLALMIASLDLEQHRLDEAQQHAEIALHDLPTEAHKLLAQIALERKDYAKATAEANAILAAQHDHPFALMILGQVAQQEGKLDEALQDYDRALARSDAQHRHEVQYLNYHRGDLLARMGRPDEAEAAFRKEIELYPHDPAPYKNLILLYVTEGKNDAATQLIFSMEKASPTPPMYLAISQTLRVIGDVNGARFWAARGLSKFPKDPQLMKQLRG
ncbi:MAG TPA: sulfatase-like hydrolase/transferase [Thermoanaerobaculia bacterium]|nr:sulfatase-like hydrolase/transferase [Thermoanaerobaculia bacterium]